jgi:cell division protein FtsN
VSKDYKARPATPRARRGRQGSCFFWFVTGAVIGGFGIGAWTLRHATPPPPGDTAAKAQPQPVTKPRFDFYSILPEIEELAAKPSPLPKVTPPQIPEQTTSQKTQAQTPTPVPATKPDADDGMSYLLQVASFRSQSDADRVKAQLALLGLHAQIQQVTINNKDTYHRVRVGPYRGKQALNQARALLSSNGFQSVPVRLK